MSNIKNNTYYSENKDKVLKTVRRYQINNKERLKIYNHNYYMLNRDRIRKKQIIYNLLHRDEIKKRHKEYSIRKLSCKNIDQTVDEIKKEVEIKPLDAKAKTLTFD